MPERDVLRERGDTTSERRDSDSGTKSLRRRSSSLKRVISRRASVSGAISRKREEADDEVPPLPDRPFKQPFVQYHVTSDDLAIRPYTAQPAIPVRTSSRATWPVTTKEREPRPGTYAFNVTPTLVPTPWEYNRAGRPASQWSRPDRATLPGGLFEHLPREILRCVLDQLKSVNSSGSVVDVSRLQADYRNLCFASKRWHRIAREHLYREIWLPRNEEPGKKKFHFRRPISRLRLLLRTLGDASGLAYMVRHLCISSSLASELDGEIFSGEQSRKASAVQTLREIILQCPNLEHLTGYTPLAVERSIGLFDALSACWRMKSFAWRLPLDAIDNELKISSTDFITLHSSWHHLETLVLWQNRDGCGVGPGTISGIVNRLPSLKHLMIKSYSATDFHNGTLLMLPALESLRLEDLPGVTEEGIEQMTTSRLAMSLRRLTLSGLELSTLRTVQTIFTNLWCLRAFTLLQNTSPELQQAFNVTSTAVSFSLASPSLEYLHWDAIIAGSATAILATSIAGGRFPALRTVKIPCDYDGAIQRLCRPIAQRPLTDLDAGAVEEWERKPGYHRSLRVAQIQAQIRIRETRQQPSFNVVIQDEDAEVQHTHVIGSYLGNVASAIDYALEPDVEHTEHALARVEDVAMPRVAGHGDIGVASGQQTLHLRALF